MKKEHIAEFLTIVTKGGVAGATAGMLINLGKPYGEHPIGDFIFKASAITMGLAAGAAVPVTIGERMVNLVSDVVDYYEPEELFEEPETKEELFEDEPAAEQG